MRVIKFRVWDKEEKKFFTPVFEAYKGNLLDLSISLGGQLLRRTLEMPCEHQSNFPDKYEITQFTGLTDKNGKEIFEGDILQWKPMGLNVVGRVEYEVQAGAFWLKWEIFNEKRYKELNATFGDGDTFRIDYMEIIGNIYENPELIQK